MVSRRLHAGPCSTVAARDVPSGAQQSGDAHQAVSGAAPGAGDLLGGLSADQWEAVAPALAAAMTTRSEELKERGNLLEDERGHLALQADVQLAMRKTKQDGLPGEELFQELTVVGRAAIQVLRDQVCTALAWP